MHLPVGGEQLPVCIDHDRRVVVISRGRPLVERHNDHHAVLPGKRRERFGRGSWNGLGKEGGISILVLREVRSPVEFLQAEDPGTLCDRRFCHIEGVLQVAVEILAHRRLDEADLLCAHLYHLTVSVGHSSVLYQPPGHSVIRYRSLYLQEKWSSRQPSSSPSALRWMRSPLRSVEGPPCGTAGPGMPSSSGRSSADSRQGCRCSGGSAG